MIHLNKVINNFNYWQLINFTVILYAIILFELIQIKQYLRIIVLQLKKLPNLKFFYIIWKIIIIMYFK